MFKTRRINDAVVTPLKLSNQFTPDQIYGYEFCTQPYATWLLCAKSRQGKGTAMYQILKHTVDPLMKTNVVIFSSTVNRDPLWERILELLEDKHCNVTCHDHFLIGKSNIMTELIEQMGEEEPEPMQRPPTEFGRLPRSMKREKRPTKISSKWLFIFDDIPGKDLRHDSLNFVMRNRHYKCKVIISAQFLNMLLPSVRKNLTNVVLFKSFSIEKLHTIYDDLDIEIPFEQFAELYTFATRKPYNFLQYDVHGNRWILNFNEEINTTPLVNEDSTESEGAR
jgi:hypothetical protein